jgi:hypothetical protein
MAHRQRFRTRLQGGALKQPSRGATSSVLQRIERLTMPVDIPAMPADEPFGFVDAPAAPGPDPGETAIRPLARKGTEWRRWLAGCVSLALFVGVLWQLRHVGLPQIAAMLDRTPAFWATFALVYFALPVSEWIIFRRLWRLPMAGLGALIRKFVSNEVLFGYSGEAYFYLWARDRVGLPNTPFGAVKDVAITSALAGNVATLATLAVAVPALRHGDLGRYSMPMLWSGLAVVGISLGILLFSRKIFSLKRSDLVFVFSVHLVRLVAATLLTALLWALALPAVGLGLWAVLAALRMLLGRLPFITNKELLFANVAILLVGSRTEVGGLMAAIAVLTLGAHLVALMLLTGLDLARAARG